jgi:thiamine pyrophosphate-dependent acetolactate synthase large subunit-like protein
MLQRKLCLKIIADQADEKTCLISSLGRISRDLFSLTSGIREKCLYNMGAMGSILPISIGLAIAKPEHKIIAIEGDGSLLMNLGGLATLKRYGGNNLFLIIMDNGEYESTGGQVSQPEGFYLEKICAAAGLSTFVASDYSDLVSFLDSSNEKLQGPQVLVLKMQSELPAERINELPEQIAERFYNWINK